ncbi:MAG TPA: BON domain-containing protein [Terriglobales bacterium]|nr:BON domain-containing protein [Terriglobales bacterium]
MRFSRFFRTLPLALALALAVACTKAPNDAQVATDIQTKLGTDSGLQNKQLGVQSDKGTVTLSGTVDNDAQREAAAKYAASVPGVKQVINNLQVASLAASSSPQQDAPPQAMPNDNSSPAPRATVNPSPSASKKHHTSNAQEAPASEPAPQANSAAAAPLAAAAPVAQNTPPPPPPAPAKVTVPSGTSVPVRLVDAIDSATAQTGDRFHATLDSPIAVDGEVVVPAHYDVEGHIVAA